jgi:hypothetical protein
MSWASLASNQWVSYTNLQNAIDTGVVTPVSGVYFPSIDRWASKDFLLSVANADPTNPYLSPKAANQWIAKRDVTAPGSITKWTLYCQLGSDWQGYSTSYEACSSGTSTNFYANVTFTGTAAIGTRLYLVPPANVLYTSGGATPFYYIYQTGNFINVGYDSSGYYIADLGFCS